MPNKYLCEDDSPEPSSTPTYSCIQIVRSDSRRRGSLALSGEESRPPCPPILPATKREVDQLRNHQKEHIKKINTEFSFGHILISHPTMILIEQTAVLTCLSHHSQHDDCNDGEEWVVVSQPKGSDVPLVQPLRPSTSFDDCCSLAETSCSSDDELGPRRVSFSGDDEVHVVDRLYPTDSLSQHFYSCEDTQRYVSPLSLLHSFLFEGANFLALIFPECRLSRQRIGTQSGSVVSVATTFRIRFILTMIFLLLLQVSSRVPT